MKTWKGEICMVKSSEPALTEKNMHDYIKTLRRIKAIASLCVSKGLQTKVCVCLCMEDKHLHKHFRQWKLWHTPLPCCLPPSSSHCLHFLFLPAYPHSFHTFLSETKETRGFRIGRDGHIGSGILVTGMIRIHDPTPSSFSPHEP